MHSACVFVYPRHTVIARLSEFPSPREASRAYAESNALMAKPTRVDNATIAYTLVPQSGIGERANWFELPPAQFGYALHKSKYVFSLEMNFKDGSQDRSLSSRVRPIMQAAARKL